MDFHKRGRVVFSGYRAAGTPNWCYNLFSPNPLLPTPPPAGHTCAAVTPATTVQDHVAFLHAAMGSPAVSTLEEAVRRGFVTLPGLTVASLTRWAPRSTATAKGHLDRNRQGQRSTRPSDDDFPRARTAPRRSRGTRVDVYTHVYADLAGKFPVPSTAHNEYLLVAFLEDWNYIRLLPLRDRTSPSVNKAFEDLFDWCEDHGLAPNFLHLDNEDSGDLLRRLKSRGIHFQYCPPSSHRANVAERCIRTAKNHLVATLTAADPSFPLRAWDLLLPQAELTLNLLRASAANPSLSAWHQAHGLYDHAAHPLAPPGTRVLAYEDSATRPSWAPHGVEAFYVGPAQAHYRSFEVFVPQTNKTRVSDTLAWFPTSVVMPGPSPAADLQAAVADLERALQACAQCPQLAQARTAVDRGVRTAAQGLQDLRAAFGTLERFDQEEAPSPAGGTLKEEPLAPTRPTGAVPTTAPNTPAPAPREPGPSAAPGPRQAPHTAAGNGSTRAQTPRENASGTQHATSSSQARPPGRPTGGGPPPARGGGRPSHSCPSCGTHVGTGVQCDRCRAWWHFGCDDRVTPQVRLRLRQAPYFCPGCCARDETCGVCGDRRDAPHTFDSVSAHKSTHEKHARALGRRTDPSGGGPRRRPRRRRQRNRRRHRPRRGDETEGSPTSASDTSDSEVDLPDLEHPDGLPVALAVTGTPPVLDTPHSFKAAMAGPDRAAWEDALDQEWERLVDTWECATFVRSDAKPRHKQACYCNPVVKVKDKPEGPVRRVRVTAGGDRIVYSGEVSADTAALESVKVLWNVLCSEGAQWACLDIVDFYLGTPLPDSEWMWVPLSLCPPATRRRYGLDALARDGKVLVRLSKGIYGLPQAGKLARDKLVDHLAHHGYEELKGSPGLFRHASRRVTFSLVVDDFGVVYHDREDAQHLVQVLEQRYQVKKDWEGSKYLGIVTRYDRARHTMTLSMPGYVEKALHALDLPRPRRETHSPRAYVPPEYGRKGPQLASPPSVSPALQQSQVKWLQRLVGIFLYYARAVDVTLTYAVSKLATELAFATEDTLQNAHRLVDYAATHPDAEVTIHASGMVLRGESDASWVTERGSRSRVGGVWFLGSHSDETPFNAPVEVVSSVTKVVATSAAEAEYLGLYHNAQVAGRLRATLTGLGYPQQATPLKTDNECAQGLIDGARQAKRTKALLMRYDWLREQVAAGAIRVFWRRGVENRADYFTKTLPVHQIISWRRQWVGADQWGQSAWLDGHKRLTQAQASKRDQGARTLDACDP